MSTIEDRLTAALNARAEQVQREDLRYAEPPRTTRPRVPRVAVYALAAAACTAAVAAPFVLRDGPADPRPLPPSTTEAPSPNGDEVRGADWKVAYTYEDEYDVDGDGTADTVVVRTEGRQELSPGLRRMEVELSTGGTAAVILDYETFDLTAISAVELDGEPGDEILYYRGTPDDGRDVGVVDLVGGALVDLTVPDDPGITATSTERDGWRGRHYWVEDDRLYTSRTVAGGFVPGGDNPGEPPHEVDVWQWRINDGALQAVPQAQQCWDPVSGELPFPCASDR